MNNESKKVIINELLAKRRSPLAFDSRPVEEDEISRLFEAARWAPSSRNEQPWRFVFATGDTPPAFNAMLSCLNEGNRVWAKEVPLLILSIAKTNSSYNNQPNKYSLHDTGMAVGNLLVQATEMGLCVHQMGGYDNDMARKIFEIPEGFEPVAMIAVGYPGNPDDLPPELQAKEKAKRTRRPLNEFVFRNRWKHG